MPGPAVKVALFRAQDDAALSGARLRKLGFRAVWAPVIEIAPVRVEISRKLYDAVIASSPRAFAGGAIAEAASPLYVVGARTARAAEAVGWRPAAPPAPSASQLVEILRRDLPKGANVLYLAGRDRKPTLEAALSERCALEVVEVYAAEARLSWRTPEIRALASCDAALHYSPRSAALAVRLAGSSGLTQRFLELRHVCLSRDVAEPLRVIHAPCVVVAERPDEPALFAALRSAVAVFPSDGASRI